MGHLGTARGHEQTNLLMGFLEVNVCNAIPAAGLVPTSRPAAAARGTVTKDRPA